MAVWLALAECDSVELLGFGPACRASDGAREPDTGSRVYYIDPKAYGAKERASFYKWHSMAAEWRWLGRLARDGIVQWGDPKCF
jgi:hypothetical protein